MSDGFITCSISFLFYWNSLKWYHINFTRHYVLGNHNNILSSVVFVLSHVLLKLLTELAFWFFLEDKDILGVMLYHLQYLLFVLYSFGNLWSDITSLASGFLFKKIFVVTLSQTVFCCCCLIFSWSWIRNFHFILSLPVSPFCSFQNFWSDITSLVSSFLCFERSWWWHLITDSIFFLSYILLK